MGSENTQPPLVGVIAVRQFQRSYHPDVAVVIRAIVPLWIWSVHIRSEQSVVVQRPDVGLVVVIESGGIFFDTPGDVDWPKTNVVLGVRFSIRAVAKRDGFELLGLLWKIDAAHPRHSSLRPNLDLIDLVVNNRASLTEYTGYANIARADGGVLLLDEGHCFRTQALQLCTRAGARETQFRATSLATLVQMVSASGGVTILPSIALPVENRRGQLTVQPFASPSPGRTLALAWRRGSALRDSLVRVAGTMRTAIAEVRSEK